jgi:hypothetical protein
MSPIITAIPQINAIKTYRILSCYLLTRQPLGHPTPPSVFHLFGGVFSVVTDRLDGTQVPSK